MNQVKSVGGKEWWVDTPNKNDLTASGERGLNEYTFRSEEDN